MFLNTFQISVRCLQSNILKTQAIKTLVKPQKYGNWAHRNPIAVINEEIVLDDAEEAPKPRKYLGESEEYTPMKQRRRRSQKPKIKPEPVVRSDATYKDDGTLNIIKLAEDDKALTNLMMTLNSRKLREHNHQILLEGHRLITDAIQAGVKPEIIIFSRKPDVVKLPLPKSGVKLCKVPYKTIQLWSNLTTTPGVIGVFEAPESFEKKATKNTIPLTIICDNVREPGNLGSILRAAAGVGCKQVLITKGCANVWEPKVLRSAAGAHFRTTILKSLDWSAINSLITPDAKIYAADNNSMVNLEDNENSEVVDENSATSSNDDDVPSLSPSEVDDLLSKTVEKSGELIESDTEIDENEKPSGKMKKVSLKELASRLPVIPYYSVDYTTNEVVLIVGGETEGLSYETIKFVDENGGVRVNVPLTNDVESLNTGMALGIIAFEVRRQFAMKKVVEE